jgi:ABC-type Fe3+ transport system substrate-binding protein
MLRAWVRELMKRSRILAFAVAAWLIMPATAGAADAALIAAAKKEGQVVWYSTLIVNQAVRPLAKAFEEKYGVAVRYSRADSGPTALKILNEARAGRLQADVFDGSGTVPPLVKAGLVADYLPPIAALYPAELKDPNRHWICTNLYFLTPGINTKLVPPNTAPRTLADLLDPRWRGRIAWSTSATAGAVAFIGTVLQQLGEEPGISYLRALARQKIVNVDASSRAVLDQVIAGDYAIALEIFNHHAVLSAAKGAPVDWLKLEPIAAPIQVASLLKAAPHPNAGKLLLEFLTSEAWLVVRTDTSFKSRRRSCRSARPISSTSRRGRSCLAVRVRSMPC